MSDAIDPLESSGDSDDDLPTAPFWMTTFADMMTLLLAFFVMIVSMSEVEVKKFEQAIKYFQGHPSVLTRNTSVVPTRFSDSNSDKEEVRTRAERYQKFLRELKKKGLGSKVQANLTDDGIHVVIADSVMFDTGESRLIEPSRTVLRLLANLLDPEVESVVVKGHTDDRPISTERFPSNWELSTARAASTVRFLQKHSPGYDPARFTAEGYGAHHPRATNKTSEGRARNRRVEIELSWRSWDNRTSLPQIPEP